MCAFWGGVYEGKQPSNSKAFYFITYITYLSISAFRFLIFRYLILHFTLTVIIILYCTLPFFSTA